MAVSLIDGTGSGYPVGVTVDNRLRVDLGGDITISGVNIDSIVIQETEPTNATKNNPSWKFEYDGANNIGSITQFIDAGSYVNVLVWEAYSGTSIGVGSNITNIGSYY